ncbi:unnamed protein product [Trifolium pratense]|uniref:Uncharacterized protein n=1 Tax=Trifolium pratense TaxID=57577 RepID=A0ACB0J7U1_TRIPR|nr:unnamed protein product [Trifolium pratense]
MTMLETVVLSIKQCVEELKEIVIKSVTPKRSNIAEVKDMDGILKKISIEKDLVEKEIRGREETSKIRSVRKLFTPEGNKTGSSPGDPITARMTSTGNYKVSPKKRDKTPSNLVGSNIPKYLTDIFHPANQMELNDVECHLAAYIFSPQEQGSCYSV